MREANRLRYELAEKIAAGYALSPKVAAVALAGSVARGWADHHSDIELDVYWAEPPTEEERVALLAAAGGQIDISWGTPPSDEEYRQILARRRGKVGQLWPLEDDEWAEHYYVGAINVGISGFLTTTIDQYLDEVINHYACDDNRQMRLAALQHGVALHGADLLEPWRTASARYPRGLSQRLIEEQLGPDQAWWAREAWLDREAHLPLLHLLHQMQVKILRILLALNKIYLPDPRFKWADRLIEQMRNRPENLGLRLKQVFELAPEEAVQATATLFAETLGLVGRHLPNIDTESIERMYEQRRSVNESL